MLLIDGTDMNRLHFATSTAVPNGFDSLFVACLVTINFLHIQCKHRSDNTAVEPRNEKACIRVFLQYPIQTWLFSQYRRFYD